MDSLWKDVRVAIRQCRRQPGFALAVVSTLALAIGANVAVFSVVNTVLLRALPFASPERIVWVSSVRADNPDAPFSLPEFMDYRERTRTLAGLGAYANWSASIAGEGITERFQGARMSANAFDIFGLTPAAGRLLQPSDDSADAPRVAVLSYRLWQRQFGGNADVVGRHLRINGEPYAVVGILPPHFPLPLRDVDVVAPLVPDREPLRHVRNSVNYLRLFGRLNPGVTREQAEAELTAICRALRQQFPVEYARKEAVKAVPIHDALVGDFRRPMLFLLGAVVVVLGTALANLLSLVLVRANERQPELSIRIALGASRLQLMRQLTVEALLLTVAGSGLGWLLAAWGTAAAMPWAPPSIPRLGETGVDGTILLFAGVVTAGVTALLSLAPLGAVMRMKAGDALRLTSRGSVGDGWNRRVRHALVVAEISAALVMVLATTVLVQSVLRLQQVQPGFSPDAVFQARVSIPPTYRSPDDLSRFYESLSERLGSMPGVQSVGLISAAPMSGLLATVPFDIVGEPARDARERLSANLRVITPGYLAAAGTRLLNGRAFQETDRPNTPPVAVVSAAFADRFLTGGALGRQIRIDDNNKGPRAVEVVGVVENVRQVALDAPPTFDVYIPLRQIHPDGVVFLRNNQFWMIRTGGAPGALRVPFLAHLRAVDPDAAIASTGTMRMFVDEWLGPRRFSLGLFTAFSLTAVLLAVSGLYGLVSYTVSQRQREIGVRMAIGATERDVYRLILREAARLGLAGAALGLCLAGAARPLASRLARDMSADPLVIAAATVLLIAVVMLAAWLPARRAARIQPTLALKGE
jgi:predicted permease